MPEKLQLAIRDLKDLLSDKSLSIPDYQRPYTWKREQVTPLLKDLHQAGGNTPLVMGTLILFQKKDGLLEIVDGQQRLTTLSIFTHFLQPDLPNMFLSKQFKHHVSVANIQANSKQISDFIKKKTKDSFKLDLTKVLFIVVYAPTIEEAFTFFDSQNNRGKALGDTDILKAHHLRYIKEEALAVDCAVNWESIEKNKSVGLNLLLETILGRGRKFSRKEISEINIKKEFHSQRENKEQTGQYHINRYQQSPVFNGWSYDAVGYGGLTLHHDHVNLQFDQQSITITDDPVRYLPFQATQSIEGGELFFWYTQKYYLLYQEVFDRNNDQTSIFFKALIKTISSFDYNTGAKYVHSVFIAALVFYIDKFGYHELDKISSHLFFSVYWLRFKQHSVQYSSVFKFTREMFNPFELINRAGYPKFLIQQMSDFLEDKYNFKEEFKGIREAMFDLLLTKDGDGLFVTYPDFHPILHNLYQPQ